MEVAAALTDKAHSVSVVGLESVPFKKALGEKVGKAIMKVGIPRQEANQPHLLHEGEILHRDMQDPRELLRRLHVCSAFFFFFFQFAFLFQLFEANRVKFYMMNEVSEMIGHHGQVF